MPGESAGAVTVRFVDLVVKCEATQAQRLDAVAAELGLIRAEDLVRETFQRFVGKTVEQLRAERRKATPPTGVDVREPHGG